VDGGAKLTRDIRNFILQSKFEMGDIGRIKLKVFIFFFVSVFHLPLFNSVTKKLFLG
jgi:hypothetical protein